ncbi:MAG: response regulator [Eubacterium sp.]|nr:response regulator [Eubacterium sp.]
MGIKDIRKDIKNKVFNSKTNDYEFSGLTDKDVQIEQELNLYTNEGQFYVLIADADDEERIIVERMVDQTGCFVTSVASGIECMDEVTKDKYDLIFLARNMPRMDGIQTMKNIKESPASRSKDAKIYILLDEKADEPDIVFESAGFDGIVRKPVDRTIIQNIIISLVPSKMLPDDEAAIEKIKAYAADAEILKGCGVRLLETLKEYKGDMESYRDLATRFVDDYEIINSSLIDSLYSGNKDEYMDGCRRMREISRGIGAVYLSYCFDDHVNMAKEDSLDVAESNWRSLVDEWENVVSGVAAWLGKTDVHIGTTEVLRGETNGIKLPKKDVEERKEEILKLLEDNNKESAYRQLQKLSLYELEPDTKLKIDRVMKAFDSENVNKAVDILKSI